MDKTAAQQKLTDLAGDIAHALGQNFVGWYIQGSFATDDWRPGLSDIDFLGITNQPLNSQEIAGIRAIHTSSKHEEIESILEGEYIDLPRLKALDFNVDIPSVIDSEFRDAYPCQLSADNVLSLMKHGKAISGKSIDDLHLVVSRDDIEAAARPWLLDIKKEIHETDDSKTLINLLIDTLRLLYLLKTNEPSTKQAAIRNNKTRLGDELYENLMKYLQADNQRFAVEKETIEALVDEALTMLPED